jgi:hypothetical protein
MNGGIKNGIGRIHDLVPETLGLPISQIYSIIVVGSQD